MRKVLCIVTGGPADQPRARRLASGMDAEVVFLDVDRSASRRDSSRRVREALNSTHWDLVYLEGTGIVGGLPLIRAAWFQKQAFLVSSGDPIGGFFRATKGPLRGCVFGAYERLLYRSCSGFVGWTPYLTGLAVSLGARRAATVEGGVDLDQFRPLPVAERSEFRRGFDIDPAHLVCGVVGTLNWDARRRYCYGWDLVQALAQVRRSDVSVLIVGDGTGRARLERSVPERLRSRVRFTGRLPREEVARAINAMDVAFNTQTLDGLGLYRLTAKLPEYLACGVPVAMSPVPGFYDYAREAGWPLPSFDPAGVLPHDQKVAAWLDGLGREEVARKAARAREIAEERFDYDRLSLRFAEFAHDLMDLHATPEAERPR